MKELSQSQVILEYERLVVEPVDGRAYLKRMHFWRSVTGGCLLLSLFGFMNVLLAIFLVPILLESDILKWHEDEDREAAREFQDLFQD